MDSTFQKLQILAENYLKFLISRDESSLKNHLPQHFSERLKITQQIKLIKSLPTALQYGLSPEAIIWSDYAFEASDSGALELSPFQFNIQHRNLMNPLITETITITVNWIRFENSEWKLLSILSDADNLLLINYASQSASVQNKQPLSEVAELRPKH